MAYAKEKQITQERIIEKMLPLDLTRSIRVHRDRGRGIGAGDRGIRGGGRGIRDGGRGIRVGSSGWTRKSVMGLGSSTPSIFAVLGKVTGLMATFTLIFVRTLSSFMGPFADRALERLTRIPHTARVALDVTLERDVMSRSRSTLFRQGGPISTWLVLKGALRKLRLH